VILGFDFDNTLIRYDELFHRAAFEKKLIPEDVPKGKAAVRDYLRENGQEDEWTRLQGEVYGPRILEALPFEGMIEILDYLQKAKVAMCIVSHKTRTPYLGEPWDLHQAARDWLNQQGFHDPALLNWPTESIFFELTKNEKIQRIVDLGCTHYVDDLPEILELLPDNVEKILFSPGKPLQFPMDWKLLQAWNKLPELLGIS
jgi:hypothetical protein